MGRLLNLKITESILELKKIQKRQVVHWLSLYRKMGIDGILLSPSRNKPSKIITEEIHQAYQLK